jgi:hypothetical protein
MQRADVVRNSGMIPTQLAVRLRDLTTDEYSPLSQNELPPSPTNSTDTPVFVTATPRSDTPPSSTMSGEFPL